MFVRSLTATLAAAISMAAACDPRKGSCSPVPGLTGKKSYNLTPSNTTGDYYYQFPDRVSAASDGSGVVFSLAQQGDAPTLLTTAYVLYGNIQASIKTAPGVGMVSAFITMSDVQDEIDWEWLGAYDTQVQTNYFWRGETANYDRGGISPVSDPQGGYHTYELDWTPTTLRWIIDGTTVRTLNKADVASNYGYPSTPSQIRIGVWASGDPTNPAGTIQWGGGPIDYSKGPYSMTLRSLTVNPYTPAGSYSYADNGQTVVVSSAGAASNAASSGTTTTASGTRSFATSAASATGVVTTAGISGAGVGAANALASQSAVGSGIPTVKASGSASASGRVSASGAAASSSTLRVIATAGASSFAHDNSALGSQVLLGVGAAAVAVAAGSWTLL
ncbi:transglycosylase [Savitreella phatthalungensis]